MKPCPKCESVDIEIESSIGVKMSGNIVETIITCNNCKFSTPVLTLWSPKEINEDSEIFKKAEVEAWKIWEQFKEIKQGEE